jgi:hypothetical protein
MDLATATTLGSVSSDSTKRLWPDRSANAPATVLELVWIVSELTSDDDEVVAMVSRVIRSGAVQFLARTDRR